MAEPETKTVETDVGTPEVETKDPKIEKLEAEIAKWKAASDKAAKEASDAKKALRAKQTAEEAAAEEAKEAAEAREKELNELRKRFAVAETSKKVMNIVGDENTANDVAAALYGAEDVDAAIAAFSKAWTAREKALRTEYGRIPAPGAGGTDGPTVTKAQLDGMSYMDRLEFATKHPDEYATLMGRNTK